MNPAPTGPMIRPWLIVLVVVVVLGGIAYWWFQGRSLSNLSTSTSPTPSSTLSNVTTSPTSNAFLLEKLKNATVVVSGTSYKLTNGQYTHPGTAPFDPDIPGKITLDENNIFIDPSNPNQAAIILNLSTMRHAGASVFPSQLTIMTNDNGDPKYLAGVILDDYFQIRIDSMSFKSNTLSITFNETVSGGETKTMVYKLNANNQLVLQ